MKEVCILSQARNYAYKHPLTSYTITGATRSDGTEPESYLGWGSAARPRADGSLGLKLSKKLGATLLSTHGQVSRGVMIRSRRSGLDKAQRGFLISYLMGVHADLD